MRTDVVRLGRLSGERTGEMMHFLSSMHADRCIADADVLVDIAHVLMLDKQKIIDREITKQLLPALLELFDEGIPEEVFDDRFEDVHAGIEAMLIESVGVDVGGRMHMGRSRNDEVATCIRIKLRDESAQADGSTLESAGGARCPRREAYARRSCRVSPTSSMPSPRPLPITSLPTNRHVLAGFRPAEGSLCPGEPSHLSGQPHSLPRDTPSTANITARLLGFDGLVTNTMDAVATRDFALEMLADLLILMANTSRLCEELIIWSTSFVKFVTLDDAFCSTSSIMPQKKNPDTAEIMRAKCGSVFGAFTGALMTVKGLPMSYNRDLQELTPSLWRGMHDAKASLRLLIDMLSSATFDTGTDEGRGRQRVSRLPPNWPIPLSGTMASRSAPPTILSAGRSRKGSLALSVLEEAAQEVGPGISVKALGLTQEKIDEVLDVNYSIALRKAPGGPAPFATKMALDERKKQLDTDSALIDKRLTKLAKAKDELIANARRLVP